MALIQMTMTSFCLKRSVQVNAYIPCDPMLMPGMVPDAGPWKTIYLLHGFVGDATHWLGFDKIGEISQMYNVAVIMPNGENHFYVDSPIRGDRYGEFIGRELVDFTRMLFPLSRERDDTIIAGVSMGGYGAILNGLKYNKTFGHVIGCSPAIVIDDINPHTYIATLTGMTTDAYYRSVFGELEGIEQSDASPRWLAAQMAQRGEEFPDIFGGCGYNDVLVEPSRTLDRDLTQLGVPHVYKEYPGSHEPLVFTPTLYDGLDRILQKMPEMPNPFWKD